MPTYVGPVVPSESISVRTQPPPGWKKGSLEESYSFLICVDGKVTKLPNYTSYGFAKEAREHILSNRTDAPISVGTMYEWANIAEINQKDDEPDVAGFRP